MTQTCLSHGHDMVLGVVSVVPRHGLSVLYFRWWRSDRAENRIGHHTTSPYQTWHAVWTYRPTPTTKVCACGKEHLNEWLHLLWYSCMRSARTEANKSTPTSLPLASHPKMAGVVDTVGPAATMRTITHRTQCPSPKDAQKKYTHTRQTKIND